MKQTSLGNDIRPAGRLVSRSIPLADGRRTTVHVLRLPWRTYRPRVVLFDRPERLVDWCRRSRVSHALAGGFFDRTAQRPLGEVVIRGLSVPHTPVDGGWGPRRGVLAVAPHPVIATRREVPPDPEGDLLQAGPILLRHRHFIFDETGDHEGFRAAKHQLDADITEGRFQRCALGISPAHFIAVAAEGGSSATAPADGDAGLSMRELARLMRGLGAVDAINLDGGGSTSLVHQGRLINRPRAGEFDPEAVGAPMFAGRPIHTAIAFELA